LDLVGGQLPRRKVGTCGPRYDCYLIRFRKRSFALLLQEISAADPKNVLWHR